MKRLTLVTIATFVSLLALLCCNPQLSTAHAATAEATPSSANPSGATGATSTPASAIGRNLLKNGTAEAETDDVKKVSGWPQMEGFTVNPYGSVGGEWDWGLSGCSTCGKQYLRIQFEDKQEHSVSQTADVSSSATQIDAGKGTAKVSAYLGGFRASDTTGKVRASFQEKDGKELGTIETQPYDTNQLPKADRGNTGLTLCENSGAVPAGARQIVFTWTAVPSGDSNSYIALGDNFALVLTETK